jgi:transcriptional regulator with XRE-family HTH domain
MYRNKIRMVRLSRGLSQEDVAQKLGTTQNAYSKIENNHTKLNESVVEQLANILGVSVADIKSPEPIIVNFHHSPQSNNEHGDETKHHLSEQLLQQLSQQLSEKDK